MAVLKLKPARPPKHAAISSAFHQSLLSTTSWTVALVRSALDAHEQGDFSESAQLAEASLRDADIFGCLQARANALSSRKGLPFSVQPSEGVDDRKARAVANVIEQQWWESCPSEEVSALQRDAIMLGVAVGRDDLRQVGDDWMPRLRRLRPAGLRWRDTEQLYYYYDRHGTDHRVTPGENGWVLHAPYGGDSWMLGAIRPIGLLWIMKSLGLRDLARASEKHGMPALAIKEPFQASDDVEGTAGSSGAQAFYGQIRKLGSESVLRLPQGTTTDEQGWSAEWLELKSQSYEIFIRLIGECRREIVSVLSGKDLGAVAVGGDGVSASQAIRGELLASDAEALATTLRDQLWKPWVSRSVDSRSELAGWPCWDVRPPTDMGARAINLKTAGEAATILSALGVDTDSILEEFGLRKNETRTPGQQDPTTG